MKVFMMIVAVMFMFACSSTVVPTTPEVKKDVPELKVVAPIVVAPIEVKKLETIVPATEPVKTDAVAPVVDKKVESKVEIKTTDKTAVKAEPVKVDVKKLVSDKNDSFMLKQNSLMRSFLHLSEEDFNRNLNAFRTNIINREVNLKFTIGETKWN